MSSLRVLVLAGLVGVLAPAVSLAQPMGTFRWQIQPYCNILSISVVQQGGLYLLNGNDDQCSAPVQASVVGLAFQNPNGTIGFGLTVVTAPGATPVHIDATITIATLGGTWRDSGGNSGTFIFTPGAGTGGAPRPVPSGGLAPGSVTTVTIAPNAVGSAQLAANAVGGAQVADGSLTTADLADGPRATFTGGNQSLALTTTDTVVRSVTLTAPAAGTVIINASGYVFFGAATTEISRCSITTGTTLDSAAFIYMSDEGVPASTAGVPFAATRGFAVPAGAFTVNLVCDVFQGTATVADTHMTAIFIPG